MFTNMSFLGCVCVCVCVRGGGMSIPDGGKKVVSLHKHFGTSYRGENYQTLCPTITGSSRDGSHGQQNNSSLHKSPWGCTFSSTAECRQRTVLLSMHKSVFHQSSLHPRRAKQRSIYYVQRGTLRTEIGASTQI